MSGTVAHSDTATTRRLRRVAFTGRLASMTRRAAGEVVRRAGGQVTTNVSRRTSMLVVGMAGWPVLPDGSVSGKLQRAETLNARGAHVEIVPETVFREAAGLDPRAATAPKGYDLEQVCGILGLEPATLRRWEALGLVRSSDGQYDFQDIVSLRTIAGLIGRGVAPAAIASSVRGLARALPDIERPLAQLKLVETSGDLLAELGDALVAPDGQLVLNFEGGEDAEPARDRVLRLDDVAAEIAATPDAWLEHGLACEEEERFDEAIAAYRQAVALSPHLPEAHFNLGNVLRAVGRLEAAQEHLLLAVARAPEMAVAWYNLADVQEELDDLPGAIASLERAVAASPTYADGHYNLAVCYDEAGRPAEARRHWEAYLGLDPVSPWAETARERLGR